MLGMCLNGPTACCTSVKAWVQFPSAQVKPGLYTGYKHVYNPGAGDLRPQDCEGLLASQCNQNSDLQI